jgi:subtilase family serine protease
MECDLLIEQTSAGPGVEGWTPQNLEAAYKLPSSSKGFGQVVAIVDAFDNPNVASDLAQYRSHFELGTAKLAKFNQYGAMRKYPRGNTGWGAEIDLDVEMVSASCPHCTIYLIEANNAVTRNLYAAEREAAKLGAHIITNSWGGNDGNASRGAFDWQHVTYLASSGDDGYGMQDPADYDSVVSVGGTILSYSASGYSERVWSGTGAGCSSVSKPWWQHDPRCSNRTGNDVSAVAAEVAEYDSFGTDGWIVAGGTSVSSPLLAGVFALAGNAKYEDGGETFWRLKKSERNQYLHYISRGSVLGCPQRFVDTYLCEAGTNQFGTYSGPAGWGTPNGIGAF